MASIEYISIDLEPIVKLRCFALSCKYNGMNNFPLDSRGPQCNLKHLEIGERGDCKSFTPITKDDQTR